VGSEGSGVEVLWAVRGGIGDGQRIQLSAPSARGGIRAGLLSIIRGLLLARHECKRLLRSRMARALRIFE
jgi:hypothetical protein